MVEKSTNQRERSRGRAEAIAVRFSEENTPNGWETIDDLGIPLYVTEVDDRLIYVLSSTRWSEVENGLRDSNIPYEYQRAGRLSRKDLNNPESWRKVDHIKQQKGVNENG